MRLEVSSIVSRPLVIDCVPSGQLTGTSEVHMLVHAPVDDGLLKYLGINQMSPATGAP